MVTDPEKQAPDTSSGSKDGNPVNTQTDPEKKAEPAQPYKVFNSQEEFDRHSAGILNSAQKKAEKELLAMLGLKPDEKDKLAKFKEAYDATLSDAEKKAKALETLEVEAKTLKAKNAELEAVVSALEKSTGKKADEMTKLIRMAKGLVDDKTTMEQALEQVMELAKSNSKPSVPHGTPPEEPSKSNPDANPFKTGNLTEQGKLMRHDIDKARTLYKEATGKKAPW